MGPSLLVSPLSSLLVSQGFGFLGALVGLPFLQGLDVPLEFLDEFVHFFYGCILGRNVIGLIGHFSC